MSEASESFYADLPSFSVFEDFADFEAYAPVPGDWVVLAGDIENSTGAIAAGRYKAVNMLGAAVITAVLNACKGVEVPFVFGGDGGAVVVPGSMADRAAAALGNLRAHADEAFGLTLRAAAVPVARLRREGYDGAVRRLELNPSNHLAMFAGGGIERVDAILKGRADDPDILPPGTGAADLDGLSCRWEPLAARHGSMIALMVQPAGAEPPGQVYRDVLRMLRDILDGRIVAHAPVRDDTIRFRWPPRGLWIEARAQAIARRSVLRQWLRALFTSAVQVWCHLTGAEVGGYQRERYLEELKAQTDFRKFDGALRTVLDCTPEQVAAIEGWLEAQYRAGRLVYGLHADRAALMTCLLFSLEQGEHMHFVDAAGGGFARAAEGFKPRLAGIRGGQAST